MPERGLSWPIKRMDSLNTAVREHVELPKTADGWKGKAVEEENGKGGGE
jgi:hypothetical protein